MAQALSVKTRRDVRIDVLRGLALLMIFVDHIPDDLLNRVTLHNFGFCDAAEVFVLLAGFSAMLAYGRAFHRDGAASGLRRIAARCGRIYLFQAGLLLTTLLVVQGWTTYYHLQPTILAPILNSPVSGLAHGLTLGALPSYLDILPLYVVLLAVFPLVYAGIRRSPVIALGVSAAIWVAAGLFPHLNLPNWVDNKGWYFDPFAWQFLFTIGAAMSVLVAASGGQLPYRRWLAWLCAGYLVFAFLEGAPWHDWGMPNLQLVALASPDKSRLNWLRILDVLALFYLLMSPARIHTLAASRWLRAVEACGKHSLEVFTLSCVVALFGRLVFRTDGFGLENQLLVNGVGIAVMCGAGLWLEHGRSTKPRPNVRFWTPLPRH
jgi:hypothetical protein